MRYDASLYSLMRDTPDLLALLAKEQVSCYAGDQVESIVAMHTVYCGNNEDTIREGGGAHSAPI